MSCNFMTSPVAHAVVRRTGWSTLFVTQRTSTPCVYLLERRAIFKIRPRSCGWWLEATVRSDSCQGMMHTKQESGVFIELSKPMVPIQLIPEWSGSNFPSLPSFSNSLLLQNRLHNRSTHMSHGPCRNEHSELEAAFVCHPSSCHYHCPVHPCLFCIPSDSFGMARNRNIPLQ